MDGSPNEFFVPVFKNGTNIITLDGHWPDGGTASEELTIISVNVIPIIDIEAGDYYNQRITRSNADHLSDWNYTFSEWVSQFEINASLNFHAYHTNGTTMYYEDWHWMVINVLNSYVSEVSSDPGLAQMFLYKRFPFFTGLNDKSNVSIGDKVPRWDWRKLYTVNGTGEWHGYKTWTLCYLDYNGMLSIDQKTGIELQGISHDENYTHKQYVSNTSLTYTIIFTPVGENVSIDDPDSGVSLMYDEVLLDGYTTIQESDFQPEPASGFEVNGEYYEITSTASYSGPIELSIPYNESAVS